MSIYDMRPLFERQNRNLNVQIRYSASFRMSKKDLNVKMRFYLTNSIVRIGFSMLKYDIRPHFECKNRILNQNTIFGLVLNVK